MNNMTTPKQEIVKRIFLHNSREKLLSLLCTIVVMLVAVCFKPVHKVYTLKIDAKTAPEQVVVSENTASVEVKVKGNFFELRRIESGDLVINFDFSSEKAGEISRNIGDNELPASFSAVDVQNISPQILVLTTEDKKGEPVETSHEASPEQKPAESESEPAEKTDVPKTDENAVKTENGEKNE